MTQYRPKKSDRPLPNGVDEEELEQQLSEAANRLFSGMVDAKGYIKITPDSLRELFSRAKHQTEEDRKNENL